MLYYLHNIAERMKYMSHNKIGTFYDYEGNEIAIEEFIKYYSNIYYLDTEPLNGIRKSSRFIENTIDDLLKKGIKSEKDVINILAWKVGKIRHRESENIKCFVYTSDWKNAKQYNMKLYGKELHVRDFVNYIVSYIKELEKMAEEQPQCVLNELNKKSPYGIGTVYMITLLYFISRGKYPIYDRFAMIAIDAITNGNKPDEFVKYKELPSKKEKGFSKLMSNGMNNYICKIEDVFGKEYQNSRDIDRALWVYGHLFKNDKKQC